MTQTPISAGSAPCFACGKTLAEHRDRNTDGVQPRMMCLGLKAPADALATARRVFDTHESALRRIVSLEQDGETYRERIAELNNQLAAAEAERDDCARGAHPSQVEIAAPGDTDPVADASVVCEEIAKLRSYLVEIGAAEIGAAELDSDIDPAALAIGLLRGYQAREVERAHPLYVVKAEPHARIEDPERLADRIRQLGAPVVVAPPGCHVEAISGFYPSGYAQPAVDLTTNKLAPLLARWRAGETEVPEGGEFSIVIDNDAVLARVHPGWDEDGEERGDPTYLERWSRPRELAREALQLLGLPAEDA